MAEEAESAIRLEVYVGEDVLQGEKEIPFYVVWNRDCPVESIDLTLEGFTGLTKLYNVEREMVNSAIEERRILGGSLKTNGYLGGLLEPMIQEKPFLRARFGVTLHLVNGAEQSALVERTIFSTTIAGIETPEVLRFPVKHPITINLEGTSTVLIDIETDEDNGIELNLPSEIDDAFRDFFGDILDEIQKIRAKYPQHEDFFERLLEPSERASFSDMMSDVQTAFDEAKKDAALVEDLKASVTAAIMFRLLDTSSIFYVLYEYFESRATDRAFLTAPLLVANVPKGESRLSLRITLRNVLGDTIAPPTIVRCNTVAKVAVCVPLKEIVTVRRTGG